MGGWLLALERAESPMQQVALTAAAVEEMVAVRQPMCACGASSELANAGAPAERWLLWASAATQCQHHLLHVLACIRRV